MNKRTVDGTLDSEVNQLASTVSILIVAYEQHGTVELV
jgi:hypothetical protein